MPHYPILMYGDKKIDALYISLLDSSLFGKKIDNNGKDKDIIVRLNIAAFGEYDESDGQYGYSMQWNLNLKEGSLHDQVKTFFKEEIEDDSDGEKTVYAFGVYVNEYRGLQRIRHSGSWDGFRASYWRFPDQKFSIVVLANHNLIRTRSFARQIADIYLKDYFIFMLNVL